VVNFPTFASKKQLHITSQWQVLTQAKLLHYHGNGLSISTSYTIDK